LKRYWATVITVAVAIIVYGYCNLITHVTVAVDKWGEASKAASHVDDAVQRLSSVTSRLDMTLDLVNRPCGAKDPEGRLLAPGTLCQVNKTVTRLGDVAVTTQRQVAQTDALVESAASSLTRTANSVVKTSDAASSLLDAARGQLEQVGPTLSSGRKAVDDLDALLRDEAVHRTLGNVASMTESGAGIMQDSRRVADKISNDYLTPKPWYVKLRTYSGDLFDFGALAARHVP
jgi:hypothetical protein